MTRKARTEGSLASVNNDMRKVMVEAAKPNGLGDVLTAFIDANPDKWEEMKLWPAQSAFAEIVKFSK